MRIYTSYYAKAKKIPDSIAKISIAGKAPTGYLGLEYKKLAPKYGFFQEWKKNHNNEYYIEHFNSEVLRCLNPYNVLDDLRYMSNGKDCILLCYEKSGDFCHRHLVADWLEKELGIEVVEWNE